MALSNANQRDGVPERANASSKSMSISAASSRAEDIDGLCTDTALPVDLLEPVVPWLSVRSLPSPLLIIPISLADKPCKKDDNIRC